MGVRPLRGQSVGRRSWSALWWPLLTTVVALWMLRPALGGGLLKGTDITGTLERVQFGLHHVLATGRLDGWYPKSMVGYEEFLIYGPGLTWFVGAVSLSTFGLLSTATALDVVIIAAFVATPPAMAYLGRSLGLDRWASWAAGLPALAVSSDRGGGIDGLFQTGLVNQHVALPVLLVALGAIVRVWKGERGPARVVLVAALAYLLLSHPPSVILLAWLAAVTLAAVVAFDASGRHVLRGLRAGAAIGLVVAGLTAFWLVPAFVHRNLTGTVTSFDTPSLHTTVRLLFDGKRGYHGLLGRLALAAVIVALVVGLSGWRVPARRAVLVYAVIGPVALVGGLLIQERMGALSLVGLQLNNRALSLYAMLGLLPLGWLASRVATALRGRVGVVGPAVLAGALLYAVVKALAPLIPHIGTVTPAPALEAAATYLHEHVPPTARFVVHDAPGRRFDLGVDPPARWLGWKADRNELNSYVPEVAPGPNLIGLVSIRLTSQNVGGWVEDVRRLAVTHIVTWDDADRAALLSSSAVTEELHDGILSIFAIVTAPDKPVGSLAGVTTLVSQRVDDANVRVTYSLPDQRVVRVALGWSPKWRATVDGRPVLVNRSLDNELLIELPSGQHHLVLHFAGDDADALGRGISVVTVAVLLLFLRRRRRARGDATGASDVTEPAEVALAGSATVPPDVVPPAPV